MLNGLYNLPGSDGWLLAVAGVVLLALCLCASRGEALWKAGKGKVAPNWEDYATKGMLIRDYPIFVRVSR